MKSCLRLALLLLAFLNNGLLPVAVADQNEVSAVPEYAMKAVYLYHFAQLTSWPEPQSASDKDFNLCVFGQDEILSALEKLRGKTVGSRILRLQQVNDVDEARSCHVLYVGEGAGTRGRRIFEALSGSPVLTITDDAKAERSGAMLQIVPEERRLAFAVNLSAARRSQLKLSSKLLNLARRVVGD